MTDAFIYDALRSPRGKGRADGALHEVTSVALSAAMLNAVAERNGLTGHAVEDVIWGNVTPIGEQGACLARSAVLASNLDQSIPGLAINRFCASGIEAVNLAANQVKGGAGQAYIAGGVEMMSRVPMGSDGAAIAADPSLAMGSYFVTADIRSIGFTGDDVAFCRQLTEEAKVTAIPVTAFYAGEDPPNHYARFAFCKNESVLREALTRIRAWMEARRGAQRVAG